MSNFAPLPPKIRGVIFDCDGVIINSRQANCLYYNKILEALNLEPLTPAQEAYTHMSTVHQALAHIVPDHLHEQVPAACDTISYYKDIMPLVELEEGFMDFIQWLQNHNIRMAVHTNRANGMPIVLDQFSLHSFFDPVITALVARPKPDPEGIAMILQAWNMDKAEVIFVGDSQNDQGAAHAAGVAFAAYGHEGLDGTVKSTTYKELKSALRAHVEPV